VTFEELDVALEELETRLERLRALYEQYFLGFEKIEPAVARKDVDRRIYVLRREKIRNTGKRFKLQTIIQRYNTFQQYWQRICREIENGTYKRHLLRAEKQLSPEAQLTIASKRRFGKIAAIANAAARGSSPPPPGPFAEMEATTATVARFGSGPPESDEQTRRPPPTAAAAAPLAQAGEPPLRRAPPAKPERPRPPSSRPPLGQKLESLELDMGFLGSWVPPAPKAKGDSSPKAAPPPKPKSSPRAAPPPPVARSVPRAAPPPKPKSSPRAAPPPKPAPAEPVRAPALSDDRVKDLHQKLSALKKENREAGQVSLESLTKTLRDTESKLRAQHQGRKIDFEVVVRDGKAIVKPTVR
jgi:hypothetical protein